MAIARITRFLQDGIWTVRLEGLSTFKAVMVRILRVIIMAGFKFDRDDCQRNASVLTYYSILNIVPLFAVLFAIAKGFGLEKLIVRQIMQVAKTANWQGDVTARIVEFSRALLDNAKGEVIVGFGVVILFWTVITILSRIEDSFNTIWEARRPRSVVRKFTDYLSLIVLAPIFFALWSSINVLVVGEVEGFMQDVGLMSGALIIVRLLPYVSIWMLLAVLYLVMPNTRISIRSAFIASFVSGILIQIAQWAYIKFQIGVAAQSAIYGSFAAIPLFLAYVQVSWTIVLFGAEIAHAVENSETYGFHPDFSRVGTAQRRLLMLRIFHLLLTTFDEGKKPLTAAETGTALRIPERFVRHILNGLVEVELVSEITRGSRGESQFQPGRPTDNITIKQVLDAYEKDETDEVGEDTGENDRLAEALRTLYDRMERSTANVKVRDI